MVTILAKFFIKNRNENTPAVRNAYGTLCGGLGILLNILLCAAKLTAGYISGSVAITADALNNLSDAGSSLITLLGFKLSAQKPDSAHPFGHGRFEYISGLAVSFLILLMGFELLKSSVEKIISGGSAEFSVIAFVILCVSVPVKLYMMFYNTRVAKKINSAAMRATAMDSLSDSIATFAVLVSLLVGHFTDLNIDGWCGLLVSGFILYSGIKSAKETINPLLGQPPEPEFVKEIEQLVLSHGDVVGIHDMIVHDYGPGRVMISLHAEVSSAGNIMDMHDTIDNIEREIGEKYNCSVVIHMDPLAVDDRAVQEKKETVKGLVRTIDSRITLHDFRMVQGNTHTNVIFDVVVPYDVKLSEKEIKDRVSELVHDNDSSLFAVVSVDRTYTM